MPDEVGHRLLDRFEEVGLVDDAAFAREWVEQRQRGRGLARRALAQELRRKGVEDEVAREALEEVDDDAEEESARRLVQARLRTVSTLDRDRATRRLVGMLARKGHSSAVAFRVVRSGAGRRRPPERGRRPGRPALSSRPRAEVSASEDLGGGRLADQSGDGHGLIGVQAAGAQRGASPAAPHGAVGQRVVAVLGIGPEAVAPRVAAGWWRTPRAPSRRPGPAGCGAARGRRARARRRRTARPPRCARAWSRGTSSSRSAPRPGWPPVRRPRRDRRGGRPRPR